jgi:hypothetical protein
LKNNVFLEKHSDAVFDAPFGHLPLTLPLYLPSNNNFATYGDALLCKAHYHQLFQMKGNYTELARTGRYTISGSTERLIEAGEITEEEAKQMLLIQAEVDAMVAGERKEIGTFCLTL